MVEAWKCDAPNCEGFVVFENADFDFTEVELIDGKYAFTAPHCSECKKQYLVVPHYIVVSNTDDPVAIKPVCITEFQKRDKELKKKGYRY